jgi:hypothetical protein
MSQVPERLSDPQDARLLQGQECQVLTLPLEPLVHFSHEETRFFQAGEDLAAESTAPDSFDEPTAVVPARPWLRRRASWALLGASVAVVACATLAVSRTDCSPPQPTASHEMRPAPLPAAAPAAAFPAVPASPATAGTVAAITDTPARLPATAVAGAAPFDEGVLDACKKAYDQGRAKDVISTCTRAFARDQQSADVAVMLAKTEFERGRTRPAFDWATKAIALDGNRADAYVFLGGAEQVFGHRAAAKAAYQRYLQLSPRGRYAADLRAVLGSL